MRPLLWLVLVAACAHAPYLPMRPDPAPPEGSTTETFVARSPPHARPVPMRPAPAPPEGSSTETFVARDGTQLLARHWAPTGDTTHAVVVLMHGLKDYSARHAHFASRLLRPGPRADA